MHGLFFNFCLSILLLRAREFQFPQFFFKLAVPYSCFHFCQIEHSMCLIHFLPKSIFH
uniref:Uncharacterized protein n=1 Tax=Meloidogyne enterolobii TaxID=390850 RepID=A0A6V7XCH7_MELEN|nr:unnamed protein product [Meloidogyne enterolobii]